MYTSNTACSSAAALLQARAIAGIAASMAEGAFAFVKAGAILVGGKRPEAAQRPTWRYDARKGPPHPHTCLVGPTGRRPRSAGPAERLLAAFSVRPSRWAPRVCSVSCIHRAKHPVTAVRAWCVTERWAGGYWEAQMSFGESGGEG